MTDRAGHAGRAHEHISAEVIRAAFVRAGPKITGPRAAAAQASLLADLLLHKAPRAPDITGSPLGADLFSRIRQAPMPEGGEACHGERLTAIRTGKVCEYLRRMEP